MTTDFSVLFNRFQGLDHIYVFETEVHDQRDNDGENDSHCKSEQITHRMYLPAEHNGIDLGGHDYEPMQKYSENKSESAAEQCQNDVFAVDVTRDLFIREPENFYGRYLPSAFGNVLYW